ncbi:class I adenylate-forming enzyme family protein [Serratia sp. AKBS12]|uniref:class I adenylate-forming enzyme family protein n=1 Tax=Serratia sp. AKBS12 TaxID=2974597 RepID=UPI0021664C9A|nr:class I adenylate-forming enzyme family protein [Serratia sp. AKBS12]MCS3405902.1 acyl--CoA ligase [Serratia sp. AKBS12]
MSVDACPNLFHSLSLSAQRAPRALALAFEGQRYSYDDFYRGVQRAMAQLHACWGLHQGQRILLAWGNTPEFCQLFYAAVGLGIEVVPLSTKLREDEVRELLSQAEPQALFYDAACQPWLANWQQGIAVSLTHWRQLELPPPDVRPAPVGRQDTAVMMFTSGTTGTPKGVLLSHGNLLAAVEAYAQTLNLSAGDSSVLAVPIYHITGLSALLALFIHVGGSLWLQHRFNAEAVLNAVREHGITFLHGSPTVFTLLTRALKEQAQRLPVAAPDTFAALRAIACGAGHLNAGLIATLAEAFPHTAIHPVYGLTETSSPATIFRGDVRRSNKAGSAGTAIPGLAIAIRDERQCALPAGAIGHIWLKGEVVSRGYWQRQQTQAACADDGWFASGDIGYLDDDGYLYIKDRSKDMINRGGEKIYSIELENLISTYPGISEVAVVPMPSPLYGEEPLAFVVTDAQSCLTSEELLDWLRPQLARFKLPARILFTRTLPRTHNGKINKRQLKRQLSQHLSLF